MKMSMKHWWNDIKRGKPKSQDLPHCHFIHHKSHVDCPVIQPGSL